jgi:cold shock CspA family protein
MKLSGYIQKYFSDRGFGFIAEHKNLHFFHITSCSFIPEVGQQVTFDIAAGRKGSAAVDVVLVSGPTTPIVSSQEGSK